MMRRHFILGDSSGIMSSSDESDDEIDMGMSMNISDMYKRKFVSKPLYDRLWRFVQKTNDAVHAKIGEYPDDAESRYVVTGKYRHLTGWYGPDNFDFDAFLADLSRTTLKYEDVLGSKVFMLSAAEAISRGVQLTHSQEIMEDRRSENTAVELTTFPISRSVR